MKILIVGGGGREHALAWKCADRPGSVIVFVAAGNAGHRTSKPNISNVDIAADDSDALVKVRRERDIDPHIVGAEGPPRKRASWTASQRRIGPARTTRAAARLEGSRHSPRNFSSVTGFRRASYATFTVADFDTDYVARSAAAAGGEADGLAAGKGVGDLRIAPVGHRDGPPSSAAASAPAR